VRPFGTDKSTKSFQHVSLFTCWKDERTSRKRGIT
jgi:hypothetical protein